MGTGGTKVTNKQTVATTNLANNSVTAAKISSLTVTGSDISAGAAIASKLATNSVTAVKISALTITGAKISAGAAIASKIATDAVTAVKISSLTVTGAKISAGAIIASKLGAAAVTPAKISANYATFVVPFMYSGSVSGTATNRMIHYFSSPATVVGMWFANSGTAAAPTSKIRVDAHVVKSIASALASTNSIFRSGAKLSNTATVQAPGFKAASGTVTGAVGAMLIVARDLTGSAVGTTKIWGGVILKQRLGY